MRIFIKDYKVPSWNTLYAGMHWSKRKEMADIAHMVVLEAVGGKQDPFPRPVTIKIEAHMKRPIDPDNVCAKLLIDGLKHAGIVKDDTHEYISSVTTRVLKSKSDHVVINVFMIAN